jgi:hypothetical protein
MSLSCDPFSVPFTGPAQDLYEHVKHLVGDNNGSISGDATAGSFSVLLPIEGSVEGTYTIDGQTVSITVTHKPLLLPCAAIENYVQEHLP